MTQRLYVTNISPSLHTQDLQTLFAGSGHVASIQIAADSGTDHGTLSAYVEMGSDSEAHAARALLDGRECAGEKLGIRWDASNGDAADHSGHSGRGDGAFDRDVKSPARAAIYPLVFSSGPRSDAARLYFASPEAEKVAAFFIAKGLAALKDEDAREAWYADWIAYQAEHRLYASVLSPKQFSTLGFELDLLKLTRFVELFAYFSPAHGYSLQVTFLGLFSILMGSNTALKREAVADLEAGRLMAFGVSEQQHGSDLLGNQFVIRESEPGRLIANGKKYYIGNANCAALISVLARKEDARTAAHARRAPLALFALRPDEPKGFGNVRKIRTLGVRAGFVGEFEATDYQLPASDIIAEGREAWDAVFGTVTLGKFFLGFAAIGICEHAFHEAATHLTNRILFGKSALDMTHLRAMTAEAYARLTAMKLYAYRALDYVHAATATDRRYLLFCAVQKARVSTEGVKVMALLSECIGAKGFEASTFFEMALRDIQLIPGLEGSTHINLGLTAQFIPNYLRGDDSNPPDPKSLSLAAGPTGENPYLMEARSGAANSIRFAPLLRAYEPLKHLRNVRVFARQVRALRRFARHQFTGHASADGTELTQLLGKGQAIVVYGQLVAENALRLSIPPEMVGAIFHLLVADLTAAALALAACSHLKPVSRMLAQRIVAIPRTTSADWDWVSQRITEYARQAPI